MAIETKLVQKLSQQLLMTPQLRQAIKLLQLGRLEYIEALEKELLENPVLESVPEEENQEESTDRDSNNTDHQPEAQSAELQNGEVRENDLNLPDSPVEWSDYLESFSDSRGMASPKGLIDFDNRPSLENTCSKSENLADHVLSQLRMSDMEKRHEAIAYQIVGNLDKNGYLCASYEEIANACGTSVFEVEDVAMKIKNLDPLGVGSRNLGECLLVQLEHRGEGEGLAARIVQSHLDKLEKRAYDRIAKMEKVAVEEVYEAVKAIQNLEPRPGRPFGDEAPYYIIPDIYVQKVGDEYVITLNEDGLPRLRVSPYYLRLLKDDNAENVKNKSYLTERLKAAAWLIKSIHQRQRTIYRVTESIVKFQRDFFDFGIEHLKPMVLKDVADDIEMHESTVSRVTTNKYAHTPHGVFELKFFFTSSIKGEKGAVSSSTVKERIKNIITEEDPENPVSDQKIVDLLESEGVHIARRTVAKYRENLGILSSSRRKKLF